MSSRFFASGLDSDSSSTDEDDIIEVAQRRVVKFNYSSENEETTHRRVVKTANEKITNEANSIVSCISNCKKINDYSSLCSRFDDLIKLNEKFSILFRDKPKPRFYIACIGELYGFISSAWDNTEGRKLLAKNSHKALAALRQKLRKFCKDNKSELDEYFLDPIGYAVEDGRENEEKPLDEAYKMIDSFRSSDGSSSDDSDEICAENLREKFLKKSTGHKSAGKPEKKDKKAQREAAVIVSDESEEWEVVKEGSVASVAPIRSFASDEDVTVAFLVRKLQEINCLRSLRRADRQHRIVMLTELYQVAAENKLCAGILVKLQLTKILALYDFNGSLFEPMKEAHWEQLLPCLKDLQDLLGEDVEVGNFRHEELLDEAPYKINGNLVAVAERLVEEHRVILKDTDPLSTFYIEKMKNEENIIEFIDFVRNYAMIRNLTADICRINVVKILLTYYKFDKSAMEALPNDSSVNMLDDLCKFIYKNDATQRLTTCAILAQIYHLALHDQWFQARDMMLMSHLQSSIQFADAGVQILYNRAMAQLGLCAFRHGLLHDAHNCLADLIISGKPRELLGQGFQFLHDSKRTREKELEQMQHKVPFHMHIAVDLLECAYLVSAMLLEVPCLTQDSDPRRKNISRAFYNLLRFSERQTLTGPPETMREFAAAASRALKAGNWTLCKDLIFNPKMNAKIWDRIPQLTPMQENIVKVIQQQALKSYINFCALPVYDSISLNILSVMFEMSHSQVVSVLAALIEDGLNASINLLETTLEFHKGALKSTLQILASQLADRLSTLMDWTERANVQERTKRSQTGMPHSFGGPSIVAYMV